MTSTVEGEKEGGREPGEGRSKSEGPGKASCAGFVNNVSESGLYSKFTEEPLQYCNQGDD